MQNPPNIVFIVFDTLRKDGLQPYSNNVSTPTLGHMAADGMQVNSVVSMSNWTIPSHASFFTGKYPHEHGIHFWDAVKGKRYSLSLRSYRSRVLPELVRQNGYNTIAFSSNPIISKLTGFDRGFDNFYETWPLYFDDLREKIRSIVKDSGSDLQTEQLDDTAIALDMIKRGRVSEFFKLSRIYMQLLRREKNAERNGFPQHKGGADTLALLRNTRLESPFFLFINFYEMHWPCSKNNMHKIYTSLERRYKGQGPDIYRIIEGKGFSREDKDKMIADYYALSPYIDELLSSLVEILREKGGYDDTVFILTSDHGQALFEGNFQGHRFLLQDEIIDLPLIISGTDGFRIVNNGGYINNADIYNIISYMSSQEEGVTIGAPRIFSESYSGISKYEEAKLRKKKTSRMDMIDYLNSPRNAVYKNGFKLVLNMRTREVEEFTKGRQPQDLEDNKDVVQDLTEEIERGTNESK